MKILRKYNLKERESRNKESGEAGKCELSCIIIARRQETLLYRAQVDTMRQVNGQEAGVTGDSIAV